MDTKIQINVMRIALIAVFFLFGFGLSISIANAAPQITITSPVNNTVYSTTSVDLNYSVTGEQGYLWMTGLISVSAHKYYPDGTYTGTSFSVNSQDGYPLGIAWDGSYFWVTGDASNRVYKYYSNGTYTGTNFNVVFQANSPTGITWDGSFFWVSDSWNVAVHKYYPDGTYTGTSFSVNSQTTNPTGIAWDGSYFWVVDNINDQAYKYYSNGTYTGTNFNVGGQDGMPAGIAWDGSYFWVTGDASNRVYKYYSNGTYTGTNFNVGGQDGNPSDIVWVSNFQTWYSLDGGANSTIQLFSPINTTLTGLSDGSHNITVYANNTAGNMNSSRVFFTVSIAPQITIQSPLNQTYATNNIWFNITLNENGSVVLAQYAGINHTLTNSTGKWWHQNTSMSDGSYFVKFYANDSAGNMNSSNVTFTVDTTPPTITIQSPTNTTYATASIWANVTLNEAGSWCGRSLDSAANTTLVNSSGNWNNLMSISDGSHSIKFYCNDTGGNMGSTSQRIFSVNTTPSLNISLKPSKSWWNDLINASGAILASGQSFSDITVTVEINNQIKCTDQTDSSGLWTCTFNAPNELGSYTVKANITLSGNSTSATTTLKVAPSWGHVFSGVANRFAHQVPILIQEPSGRIHWVWVTVVVGIA